MLHVACCLWDANQRSQAFSRCYDESWVEKLYRGFRRNLSMPFRFVCFTDRERRFAEPIEQERLQAAVPDYGCLIEPFRLNEPTIICGLDTVVLGQVDHMARYCLEGEAIALPAHPSKPEVTINPIVFVPKGHRQVFDGWRGENDMVWLDGQRHVKTDAMWPGEILSLKLHDVRRKGTQGARIIYFHGGPKASDLGHVDWVREHWR
jgi:hypothetical protein